MVEEKAETGGDSAAKDIVAEYRKETESHFKEIAGMEAEDIEAFVIAEAQKTLDDMNLHVEIVDAVLIGNNPKDNDRDRENLYVAVEYRADESEQEIANALDKETLEIGGVRIDIIPITEKETGTLAEFLPKAEEHIMAARNRSQEYKPLAKVEELEEENYNQIDNYLSNSKPKAEEIREKRQEEAGNIKNLSPKYRPSLIARMREKKAIVDARKTTEKPAEQQRKVEKIV